MTDRTLKDLSTDELNQLSAASKSGTYSDKDLSIIKTLNNDTLQNLSKSLHPVQPQQQQDNSSLLDKAANIADYPIAAVSGIRRGLMDTVGSMGELAGNILKITAKPFDSSGKITKGIQNIQDIASDKYGQFKDYVNSNPIDIQANQKHPIVNAVGAGTGNVLSGMALSNVIASPIMKAASPVLDSVLPVSSSSTPAQAGIREAANQVLPGGIMGAAQNPDNPGKGFLTGAAIAAPLGYLAGNVGQRVNRTGAIIKDVQSDAETAGLDPNSLQVKDKIRAELSSGGKDLKREEITTQIQKNIQDKLGESPEVLKAKVNAAYKPLNDSSGADIPVNSRQALDSLKESMPSLGLPKAELKDNMTIKELMDYNKKLNGLKDAAWRQVKNGTMTYDDAMQYSNLSTAVDSDIQSLASKQGLDNQFNIAQKTAFDASIKGKINQVFNMSMTGEEGRLNLMRFDRAMNKMVNDPKVKANPEMLQTIKGLRKVVTYGRSTIKGSLSPKNVGVIERTYQSLIHSDAGISLLQKLGSTSYTSNVFKEMAKQLIIGSAIRGKALSDQANQSQNPQ